MTTKSRTGADKGGKLNVRRDRLRKVFKARLRELLREKDDRGKDYTIQRFANLFGAKINTVRDWLNGRVLPRTEALYAIAEHFKVTTDWLLGVEGAPKYRNQVREKPELAQDISHHVSREVMRRVIAGRRLHETFAGHLLGWRYDGQRILDLAVAREVEHLRNAFRGYDAAAEDVRSQFRQWPFRGGTERQRRADDSRVTMLVKHAMAAIAVSRFESDRSGLVRTDQSGVGGAVKALSERGIKP